jgi:CHAT domain-containing protein
MESHKDAFIRRITEQVRCQLELRQQEELERKRLSQIRIERMRQNRIKKDREAQHKLEREKYEKLAQEYLLDSDELDSKRLADIRTQYQQLELNRHGVTMSEPLAAEPLAAAAEPDEENMDTIIDSILHDYAATTAAIMPATTAADAPVEKQAMMPQKRSIWIYVMIIIVAYIICMI